MTEFDDIFREIAAGERQQEAFRAQAASTAEQARREFAEERAKTLRMAQWATGLLLAKPVTTEPLGYGDWVKRKGLFAKGNEQVFRKVLDGWKVASLSHVKRGDDGYDTTISDGVIVLQPNGILLAVSSFRAASGMIPFTLDGPGPLESYAPNTKPFVFYNFSENDVQTSIARLLMSNGLA